MIAFVESYWSRTHHAQDAEQCAHALCAHKNLAVPPALEFAAALRSLVSGDLGSRMRSLHRILLPDVVGSDPGLAVALALGQASVLLTRSEVNEARVMLQEAAHRVPPLLAVMRDVMLADLDTCLGRPHAALKLLRSYQGGELATLTAIPSARAHLALGDLRSAQDCVRAVLTTPSTQTGRFQLVEAMLCGRPAIVTDVGGNCEMIEDNVNGFVAPAPTADLFDEALKRAWQRRAEWPALGRNAQLTARKLVPADPGGVMAEKLLAAARHSA